MAAGIGGSMESTLERKFQNVSNTMDSIQGLSTWCIDNKKYHSLIVRHWIKCLRKSDAPHRLNLFYLANDVIQNCKRKNAIVYRTAFAEVLRDAFLLVNAEGDQKVMKSVERILTIWEERGVYSGTLITDLKSSLVKEESPPETPVEQKTPVESTADLRSKVVAEFVPQALVEELSKYKKSVNEVDLREKQLAAMRVDICSSKALRKLKDKAGGKKFSKDFEEGSAQLQEFVKLLNQHCKTGPPAMQALSNADIFYETQYKEVKIVANAYQTFANRVSHLKRKLDTLKSTLPDLDESPIPSPSADAPSPTGSESPFHGLGLAHPDPDLDGSAMDEEAEPPAPSPLSSPGASPKDMQALGESDNREVEDMELSEEEMDSSGIIVEERIEGPTQPEVSTPVPTKAEPSVAPEQPAAPLTPSVAAPAAAAESVDLAKIGSILSSLSSVMKNSGPSAVPPVENPPAPVPVSAPVKSTPAAPVVPHDARSLVNILSKVDVSPADLISALSKVKGQGSHDGEKSTNSLLSSPAVKVSSESSGTGKLPPASSSALKVPSQSPSLSSPAPAPSLPSSTVKQSAGPQAPSQTSNAASALVQALHRNMDLAAETEPSSTSSESLDSKIHSFLKGNSVFNAFDLGFSTAPVQGGDNLSPVAGADAPDGTPVRDEGGGTPTQDEMMDKPVVAPFISNSKQPPREGTFETAPVTYQSNSQQIPNNLQQPAQLTPGMAQNGQRYQPYGKPEMSERGITAPVAHYQQISALTGGSVAGDRAPGSATGTQAGNERGWYGDIYPEGNSQPPLGYSVSAPGGPGVNKTPGRYPYQTEQSQQPQEVTSQQGNNAFPSYFGRTLPPVPKFPPPPQHFDPVPPVTSGGMIPQEQQPMIRTDTGEGMGTRVDAVISGLVVHDHQHKSMFRSDDPLYGHDPAHPPHPPHPEDLGAHPGDLRYQEDPEYYHDEPGHRHAFNAQDTPFHPQDDPYFRPGGTPHRFPRVRPHLAPPQPPSEDPYFAHDYPRHGPPPPHYTARRPPPHPEVRHRGLRPPHRPPHPAHHPPPRGPPHPTFPRFHGPDARLRGKRPGPRGGGMEGPLFGPKRPFPPPRY